MNRFVPPLLVCLASQSMGVDLAPPGSALDAARTTHLARVLPGGISSGGAQYRLVVVRHPIDAALALAQGPMVVGRGGTGYQVTIVRSILPLFVPSGTGFGRVQVTGPNAKVVNHTTVSGTPILSAK